GWFNRWRGRTETRFLPETGFLGGDRSATGGNRARRSFRPRLEQLEERRLLYAGMLDHAFGTDGMASIDLLTLSNQFVPLHAPRSPFRRTARSWSAVISHQEERATP